MKYLIDSNTFISAKNDYYRFEFAPSFWRWLITSHSDGRLFSIMRIRRELLDGEGDSIRNWAKANGSFFLPEDAQTSASMGLVAQWVQANGQFTDAAKVDFFRGADHTLIAHAHAHQFNIVTFEKDRPEAKAKIQIPTVCSHFGVKTLTLFQLLVELKATL